MCNFKKTWNIDASDFVAAAKARSAFRAALGPVSTPDADLDGSEIIFGELMTNALRYSEGAASAELCCLGDRFVLKIRDGGTGFDPAAVASGPRRGDVEGGRGLMIAARLATNLHVAVSSDGCTVSADLPALCRHNA